MTHYCLAKWDDTDADEQDAHGRMPGWHPPQGTVGLFDMRPSSANEFGFFALDHEPTSDDWLGTDSPDLHILNDGTDLREYHMNGAEKDEWRNLLNLSTSDMADSDVDTLEDALVWTFERCGDPEHAERFKPPTATTAGNIELHLGGHSLMSRTPFARLPRAAQDRTLAVVQKDMGRLLDLCRMSADEARRRHIVRPPRDHYRRVATRMMWKYPTVEDWRRLFPRGKRGEVEPPMRPHTTIVDDFTDTDGTLLINHAATGSGGTTGWGWSDDQSSEDHFKIDNNTCSGDPVAYSANARAEYDLSSDDMAVTCTLTGSSRPVRLSARQSASTYGDCYGGGYHDNDDVKEITKGQGYYPTRLASVSPFETGTYTLTVDGSTMALDYEGSEVLTASDTEHSGFTRSGIWCYATGRFDDFQAEDLSAGVVGSPAGIGHAHAVGSPDVSQTHIASPNPLAHGQSIASPGIVQTHKAAPFGLSHGHTVAVPGIAQVHVTTPGSLAHGHVLASPGISQVHRGAPDGLVHGHVLESPATGATITGSPADIAHGHSLAEPGVAQTHIATPAELQHGHALGVPTVAVIYHGDPADLQHSHTIESLIQYIAGTLEGEIQVKHSLSAGLNIEHMLSGELKVIHVLEADLEVE